MIMEQVCRRALIESRPLLVYYRPFIVRVLHGKLHDVREMRGYPQSEAVQEAVQEVARRIREDMEASVLEFMRAMAKAAPTFREAAENMRRLGAALAEAADDDGE